MRQNAVRFERWNVDDSHENPPWQNPLDLNQPGEEKRGIELFREKTKRNNSGREQKIIIAVQLLKFKVEQYTLNIMALLRRNIQLWTLIK
jgi:hypothetical protein